MKFDDPYYLMLLIVVPGLIYIYSKRHFRREGFITYSDLSVINRLAPSWKQRFRHLLFIVRMLTLSLAVVALARPQSSFTEEEIITEGIDIILAIDVSSSMRAVDFKPSNRLEAAKIVAADFIDGRVYDRIGMVVFAGRSYTQCPLTLDYGIVHSYLESIHIGMVEDGTAIGMAITTAVNRLRNSATESKVVILLTDGRNNRGELDPVTASQIALAMNVKIYTIGMGNQGTVLYPVDDPIRGQRMVPVQADIDEDILRKIADTTGGHYFRATDEKKLDEIFKQIGEMEKSEIQVNEYTRHAELFEWFGMPVFLLLLLEIALSQTVFRKIP